MNHLAFGNATEFTTRHPQAAGAIEENVGRISEYGRESRGSGNGAGLDANLFLFQPQSPVRTLRDFCNEPPAELLAGPPEKRLPSRQKKYTVLRGHPQSPC